MSSERYAICRQVNEVPTNGSPYVECWAEPVLITPEQAALGVMTYDEIAAVLIRRKLKADLPGAEGMLVLTAQDLGVWPKGDS